MTVAQAEAHGKEFSKTYDNAASPWKKNFNSMAKKTVLKGLISKFGPMSLEMQKSINADQGIVENFETGEIQYPDNPNQTPSSVIEVNANTIVENDELTE